MTNQRTRNDHRHRRFAPAIVIAVVVIGASIFASAHLGSATSVTETATTLRSLTNTTGTTLYAPGPCLKEVPQSAIVNPAQNSTFQGYSVTYSNGTEDFFSLNSCPIPVTPDKYQVFYLIEANPNFIAAENGSAYAANPFDSFGPSMGNSTGQYAVLLFALYGNEKTNPCGEDVWVYKELGAIQAIIPINSTGGLQLSGAEIQTVIRGSPYGIHC